MDTPLPARRRAFASLEAFLPPTIFVVVFLLFWQSPIKNMGDSKYTLLLTNNLLSKGSFLLDAYPIPHKPVVHVGKVELDGDTYQIEVFDGHFYNYFPPGSAILSAPFVLVGNALGYGIFDANHVYSENQESHVQQFIASLLMAGLAVTFYFTARLLLPCGWSALLALGGVLGTQVWSTASRALWAHTWGTALLGVALYLLLAQAAGRRRAHPVLLATLLSWTYFVRPTNSLFIIGITVYVVLYHRRMFAAYAVTGAAWFVGFAGWSYEHFHKLLPSYYQANRLETTHFWEAFAGNLISPSRGEFIYVPVALFILFLLARHWPRVLHRPLVWLTLAVSTAHLLAVSCFVPWYGGWCYGPRYSTELVPWLALLATLGTGAALRWREENRALRRGAVVWYTTLAAGSALLLLSVWINRRGANVEATARWNFFPVSVDDRTDRVWDWRHPQILAGLVPSPEPTVFPAVDGRRVAFGHEAGKALEWDGWSGSDADFCWSDATTATLVFTADDLAANHLRLCFGPYLHPKQLRRQRIDIRLNDQPVTALKVDRADPQEYDFPLPAGVLHHRNVLTFKLPDATSPKAMEESQDDRTLGIALRWLELAR